MLDGLAQRLTALLARDVDREPSRGGIAVQGLNGHAVPAHLRHVLDTDAGADR